MLICILLVSCLALPAFAREGTEGDELQVLQPENLEIYLGAEFAGAQFSLKTDAGMYPGTVVADDQGVLRMEIGGSSAYVLTRLNPSAVAEVDVPQTTAVEGSAASEAGQNAETVPAGTAQQPARQSNAIPTKHIILFAGGTVLCAAFLVTSFVLKRKREKNYDEEDENY